MAKSEVFVTTFAAARNYTDQWANLNFIIRMKKLVEDDETKKDSENTAEVSMSGNNPSSSAMSGSESVSGTSSSNQSASVDMNDAEMQFEEEPAHNEQPSVNESQLRQSSLTDAINIPIVTSSTS